MNDSIQLLKELVEINSVTQNLEGVKKVQARVALELQQLGFDVIYHDHPENNGYQFLEGRLHRGGNNRKSNWIDLMVHADTVYEPGNPEFKFDESQSRAMGSGAIDDKGGIVVALEGLKKFLSKSHDQEFQMRFLCSPSEEIGSPGFGELLKKLGSESQLALGFEPSLENGSIISQRRGNRWLDIFVTGKEGHAGRDHFTSVNSSHELIAKLNQIYQLIDEKKEITVNIGQIQGGSKHNIICGHSSAKVDVRFSNFPTRDEVFAKIEKILNSQCIPQNRLGESPETKWKVVDDCPPFSQFPASVPFLNEYLRIVQEVEGKTITIEAGGGASDLNYMSRPGLILMDGLGATGGGMHTRNEFVWTESLKTRSEALARFLEYVIRNLK